MMSDGHAEAGEQDKAPADRLLPDITAEGAVKGPVHIEEIDQIPGSVIGDHAYKRDAPKEVDDFQAL